MIETPKTKRLAAVSLILAGLTFISSLAGLVHVEKYNPFISKLFIPGTVSQDIVSLVVSLLLILVLRAMRRGAPRCAWIWSGLVAYLFYSYAILSFDRIYTVFYPAYIAIFSLSLFGLGLLYTSLQPEALTLATYNRQPRWLFAGYLIIYSGVIAGAWINHVIHAIQNGIRPEGNSIFVLDLAVFIPLMLVGAVQIFKKTLLGHSLAGMLIIKAGISALSVFIGLLLRPRYGMPLDMGNLVLFAFLGLGGVSLSVLFLQRLEVR